MRRSRDGATPKIVRRDPRNIGRTTVRAGTIPHAMRESSSSHEPADLLLERSDEVVQIDALLGSAQSGTGSAILLHGPPGIGKTTLTSIANARAESRGFRVARARGRLLERDYAFGAALQLFEPLVGHDRLFDGGAALARPLLDPASRDRLPDGDTFSIVHGLFWLTSHLGDSAPTLLVVDDLQWVDDPTQRFLSYLIERCGDLSVSVLLTMRAEPDHTTSPSTDDTLERFAAVARIEPAPLSPDSVETLADAFLGDGLPHGPIALECHRMTGGNPLLVIETLRELADSGILPITGRDEPPASMLLPAVTPRLNRLGPPARGIAEAAAVIGEAAIDVLAEVAGLTSDAAADGLRELRAATLFAPDDPVRVTHGTVGEAIDTALDDDRRAALHLAAFEALDHRDAPLQVLAAHARASRPGGSPRLIPVLRESARTAIARGQPRHAVADLGRVLAEDLDTATRAEVLGRLARAKALGGDPDWADDLDASIALDPAGEPLARVRVGDALHTRGELGTAARQYELGLDAVPDQSSELGLRLLVGVSQASLIDVTNQRSWLERVEAILGPDPGGATRAERDLLRHLAYAWAISAGTRKEVLDLAHRGLQAGDPMALARESTFGVGVLALLFADDETLVADLLDRVIDQARARGRLVLLAGMANYRGIRRLWSGQADGALSDLLQACETLADASIGVLPAARGNLALVHLELDDLDAADQVMALPTGSHTSETTASYNAWLWARAQVRVAHGDLSGALDDLLECGRRERLIGSVNPATIPWEFRAGQILERIGRGSEGRELVAEALDHARRFDAPRTLAIGLRSWATFERGSRRLDRLTEAVDLVQDTPWRLELVRSVLALGRELDASGRRHDARIRFREALDMAEECGLRRLRSSAERSLRATGARPRRTRITGADALTPTERAVADMAAAGSSNRDIAEQRFVTIKAVEFHLGNVYRKLGIQGRNDLARALRD